MCWVGKVYRMKNLDGDAVHTIEDRQKVVHHPPLAFKLLHSAVSPLSTSASWCKYDGYMYPTCRAELEHVV